MSRLSTCLVGFGYWGRNLARNIAASTEAELAAIIEPDGARAAEARRMHPQVRVAGLLDEVLDVVDAVVVATPATTHHAVAMQAIEAQRHVLVEKPLAMGVADARELTGAARRHGVVLSVGHTFLYSSPVRHLRAMIGRGEFGDLRYMSFQRRSLGRIRPDCNVMWNLAPHDVAIALHLLDERPVDVWATGFSFIQPGIEDVVFATLRMPSGVGVGLHLSWLDPRKTRQMTLVGSDRMAVYDDVSIDRTIQVFDSGVETPEAGLGDFDSMAAWQWKTRAGDVLVPRLERWEPLRRQVDEFSEACRTGGQTITDGNHGLAVVEVLAALETSLAEEGRAIRLDPLASWSANETSA